jgi:hypothetical protein
MGNVAFFFAVQGQMLTLTIVAIPMIFASLVGGAITDSVERW